MSQFNVTTRCDGCSLFHRIHLSLPQTIIALAAKYCQEKYQNHQGNDPWRPAAKQNLPRIERQENSINLAASRQESFTWQFGHQEK